MCFLLILHCDFSVLTWGYCPWITAYQVLLPWQRSDNQLLLVVISCRCCYFRQAYWLSRKVDLIYKDSLFWQNLPVTTVWIMELSLSFVRTYCFLIFIVQKYRSTCLLCGVHLEKEQINHNVCDETGMNEICSIDSLTHVNQISMLSWPLKVTNTTLLAVKTYTS